MTQSKFDNIPDELKLHKAWVLWKRLPSSVPGKKPRKVPFYANGKPREGTQGDANDLAQLATYAEVMAACLKGGYAGIGFATLPQFKIVALDFDNVVEGDNVHPDVPVLCEETYAEISPSGTGIRAFFTGALKSRKDTTGENGAFALEVFGDSGFVTCTGDVLPMCELFGDSNTVAPLSDTVLAEYEKRWGGMGGGTGMVAQSENDKDLLALGMAARIGWSIPQARTILDDCDPSCGRDPWVNVGMALHHEFDGSEEAFELYLEWSAKGTTFDSEKDVRGRWRSFGKRTADGKLITGAWLISYRKECIARMPSTPTATHTLSQFEAERRAHQKAENERIGAGTDTVPVSDPITLEIALRRFVFLSDGARVADIFYSHYDLSYQDWAATYAASKERVPQPDKVAKGQAEKRPDKEVPVSSLWLQSAGRKTAVCRTFKADGGLILPDPNGRLALNTWRPFDRSVPAGDNIAVFLDHIALLFPIANDRERFLDWLAHIEQRPGELPHTAWLHIARNFGLGRNWLASVLARVWAGNVAANYDLVQTLRSGFNGQLSRKVLAVVDEIREGGRDSQWEHAEKMKSLITEEHRTVNPKYARQSVEFNACRWLMFSNHLTAIPMEAGDRRIEVVTTEAVPMGGDYYARLYAALKDPAFIAGVAAYLGQRDICKFNPGAHAVKTEAKLAATKASQSPMAAWCQMLVDAWPADVITSADLFNVLEGDKLEGELNSAHRRTLETFGIESYERAIKVHGKLRRVSILRNKTKWHLATPAELREELRKTSAAATGCREFLMLQTAEPNDEEPETCDLF